MFVRIGSPFVALRCCIALTAMFIAGLAWSATPAPPAFVADEILVAFKPGTAAADIAAVHSRAGAQLSRTIDAIGVQVVKVPSGNVTNLLQVYRSNPNVAYAEPNYLRPLVIPNEGSFAGGIDVFDEQWNLHNQGTALQTYTDPNTGLPGWQVTAIDADIDAPEAWDVEQGSASVWVAVPDSGVDCNHGDLAGKCMHEEDLVTPTVDSFGNPIPDFVDQLGHGTHVAGTIAMTTDNGAGGAGVGWNTAIGSFKVCYAEIYVGIILGSSCQDADIATAITRATDLGYSVINMSFGQATPSAVVKSAIDYADAHGVVLVAAAGNNNDWLRYYPAAYANVIAVGATNAFDDRAGFSTFSVDDDHDPATSDDDWVDVLAPGDPILSTVPNVFCSQTATQCFGWKMGTSMAAPHVSAVAALLWSYLYSNDPANANSTEIRRRIDECADPVGALGQNMLAWSRYGRLNAAGALTCGGGSGGPPPPPPSGTHIGDLDATASSPGGNSWTSSLAVTVHDETEAPLAGATVNVVADYGAGTANRSCVTSGAGVCTTADLSLHKRNGAVTYSVLSVSGGGYNPADNHDPDGDSDGTSILVVKP
jgi:thermitase